MWQRVQLSARWTRSKVKCHWASLCWRYNGEIAIPILIFFKKCLTYIFIFLKFGVSRPNDEIVKEVIQKVRNHIGPVASFKIACVVDRYDNMLRQIWERLTSYCHTLFEWELPSFFLSFILLFIQTVTSDCQRRGRVRCCVARWRRSLMGVPTRLLPPSTTLWHWLRSSAPSQLLGTPFNNNNNNRNSPEPVCWLALWYSVCVCVCVCVWKDTTMCVKNKKQKKTKEQRTTKKQKTVLWISCGQTKSQSYCCCCCCLLISGMVGSRALCMSN